MTVVLDAGAFIAAENGGADLMVVLKRERQLGRAPITHGGVVAQAWRGGSGGQTRLSRLLAATRVVEVDEELGRTAGLILRAAGGSDAIDALVIAIARDYDEILTSDAGDLDLLAAAANLHVDIIAI